MGRRIDPSWGGPIELFLVPASHDWCNKGRGMCYPVSGMVHIKEPLLLIDKSSLCGGSGFPFSLSEWSLTICLTPYNSRLNGLSASLNKTFFSLSLLNLVGRKSSSSPDLSLPLFKLCEYSKTDHVARHRLHIINLLVASLILISHQYLFSPQTAINVSLRLSVGVAWP